jgi:hypothetical protein
MRHKHDPTSLLSLTSLPQQSCFGTQMLLNIRTLFFYDNILIGYKAKEMNGKVRQKFCDFFTT